MIARSRTSRHLLAVDLTPMIDVVLQLIIFFMFTSHFGQLRRTEIDLPREQGEEAKGEQQQPAMIVDIHADGTLYFESRPTSLAEIERIARAGLTKAQSGGPRFDVLIRPDRNAPAVHLDPLLARLSSIGVRDWKIGTIVPDGAAQ